MNTINGIDDSDYMVPLLRGEGRPAFKDNMRRPLSCRSCRKSKLRCDRKYPCSACRRRRCVDSCIYDGNIQPYKAVAMEDNDVDLSARVKELEAVVQQFLNNGRYDIPTQGAPRRENFNISDSPLTAPSSSLGDMSPPARPSFEGTNSIDGSLKSTRAIDNSDGGFIGVLSGGESGPNGIRYQLNQSSWNSVLAESPIQLSVAAIEEDGSSLDSTFTLNFQFPFDTHATADSATLLALLPPKQQCDYLISRYMTLFSPLFHILHDPTFQSDYGRFSQNPRSASLSWLALLFAILTLAVSTLEDTDPVLNDLGREATGDDNIKTLTSRFRGAAMKCLAADHFLVRHRLCSFQALILLIYDVNQSHENSLSWALLGLTMNIGIALGCHVDGKSLKLSCLDTEIRRRCWAGLVMLQTIHAISFGKPDIVGLSRNRTCLPADVNDVDILPNVVMPPSSSPTQMSYMLFKFQLYDITSRICDGTFGNSKPSREVVDQLDREIAAEQQKWDDRYLQDGGANLLPYHDQAHWNILHGCAHQLYLLLHRPFFSYHMQSNTDFSAESRNRCCTSAKALLDLHKMFCEAPQFKQYMWYARGVGSFHALHAAVVLVALLLDEPDCLDAYESRIALDELIERFAGFANRSQVCARSIPVLRFLRSLVPVQEIPEGMALGSADLSLRANYDESLETLNDILALEPNQWLDPIQIDWNQWDMLSSL